MIVAIVAIVCGYASMHEDSPGLRGHAFAADTTDLQGGTIVIGDPSGSGEAASSEETPLQKAMRLIRALPEDPGRVNETDRAAISEAQAAYDILSDAEKTALDTTYVPGKDPTYGRWLETAQWGLLALRPIDNSLAIADGDYSAYASSSSTMGKSTSPRNKKWKAVSLTVENGKAWVVLRCHKESGETSESELRFMRVGGVEYPARVVDNVPEFKVPVAPNTAMAATIRANNISTSIAVQVSVSLPLEKAY